MPWQDTFARLKQFQEANGHAHVMQEHALGVWATTQRQKLKHHKLTKEREELLRSHVCKRAKECVRGGGACGCVCVCVYVCMRVCVYACVCVYPTSGGI